MSFRLKSLSTFPPGGWEYRQKETGWSVPDGVSFNQAVNRIIEHRVANKMALPTGVNAVAEELEQFTCRRLLFNPHYVLALEDEKKKPSLSQAIKSLAAKPLQALKNPVVQLVEKIRNSASGLRALREWFGDGGLPVDQETAESRADVCIACPKNNLSDGVWSKFTKPVASAIKRHVKVKKELDLKIEGEEKLGVCDACDCHLPLKAWVPIQHIQENTSASVFEELAPQCWIRKEWK